MLVVDAANVVGSRPTGWWRDRAAAARNLQRQLLDALRAGRLVPPVVLVLEGAARSGIPVGEGDGVRVVHASRHGDDAIVDEVAALAPHGHVTVVTADRQLRDRVRQLGADVVGPSWLLDRL